MKPNIEIEPLFQGSLSPIDLLNWEGTSYIVILSKFGGGKVFSLECGDFEFSLNVINNEFILSRQGIKISVPLIDNKMIVSIRWSTNDISLSVNGKFVEQETPYIVPPAELI